MTLEILPCQVPLWFIDGEIAHLICITTDSPASFSLARFARPEQKVITPSMTPMNPRSPKIDDTTETVAVHCAMLKFSDVFLRSRKG